MKADTSKLQAVADAAAAEVAKEKKKATAADWIFLIGVSLLVSAISQSVGASLNASLKAVGLGMFDKGTMTTVFDDLIEITTSWKSIFLQIRRNSMQLSTMPSGVSP